MCATGRAHSGQLGALGVLRNELVDGFAVNHTVLAQHRHLLCYVLQLPHIARPLVFQQHGLGLVGKRYLGQVVLLGHLHGEQAEQQHDVLAAVAQRRHLYGYGAQAVIQVLTEAALAYGAAHVHVGGGHNAHVGLHYALSADADILARLKHAQQACLRSQRQLAHLVEEDGTLVGHAEVALTLPYRAGERPLLVTEQLAIYRPLGYRTAVDGKILLATARRIVVYYARNNLLAHTALAHDEHRQVCRRNLHGHVDCTVQPGAVAHYAIPLLYLLQFSSVHLADKITHFI